ncbi:MAG: carboxypeptidase-like regulatory domain-containing protein [Acidobacteriota bacterium]
MKSTLRIRPLFGLVFAYFLCSATGAFGQGTGAIGGTVTDALSGDHLASITVRLWNEDASTFVTDQTDENGVYRFAGLTAGTFFPVTFDAVYADEDLAGAFCWNGGGDPSDSPRACDPSDGEAVALLDGEVVTDADFTLREAGKISGQVIAAATTDPVSGPSVQIFDDQGNLLAERDLAADGTYEFDRLFEASYFMRATVGDFLAELYDALWCPNPAVGLCDPVLGTPIAVIFGQTTPGIDFALDMPGSLTGMVIGEDSGEPLRAAQVEVFDNLGRRLDTATTTSEGTFETGPLVPGNYYLLTSAVTYLSEVYSDLSCALETCDPLSGAAILVNPETPTAVPTIALETAGSVTGQVVDSISGAGIPGARVELLFGDTLISEATTLGDGTYTLNGVPTGTYVVTADAPNYGKQIFDGVDCDGDFCDNNQAMPVSVTEGTDVPDIDFALTSFLVFNCEPSAIALCLNHGRFQVTANWENPRDNALGLAFADSLTDDTGTFYFFAEDNVELVIKVLDACAEATPAYWVFAAGLTNVEVEIQVVDTWTGTTWLGGNSFGIPFVPIQDTGAFLTCDAAPPTNARPAPERATAEAPISLVAGGALQSFDRPGGLGGNCTPSPNRLCLQGGRFAVEADWETLSGDSGLAGAVELTPESGYFWFFDQENVELLVKVLDACNLDPFYSYWVFSTGLTNVEVLIRVTDTATGEMMEYENPQGTAFQPRFDTGAFSPPGECVPPNV